MSRPWRPPDSEGEILEGLFAHPPVSQAELEARLHGGRPTRLRELLVQRLREHRIGDQENGLLLAAFGQLGVAEARVALAGLVDDTGQPIEHRARALTVLLEDDPSSLEQLLGKLPESEVAPLAEQWLTQLLGAIQGEPREAELLAETLEAAPAAMRSFLFEQVEELRQRAGTSAAAAYGPAVRRAILDGLRGRMLACIVEEAKPDGIALLEQLWKQAAPGPRRRELHGAVFRARTRRIEPPVGPAPQGHAYVGSCDGQGAFVLIGCLENRDGTLTLVDLCARAGAEIRDGFVLPRRLPRHVDEVLEEISRGTGISFARVELSEAALLVSEAAARCRELALDLPSDAQLAVQLFERVERRPKGTSSPPPAELSLAAVRSLLRRPEYVQSWFFDRGDLQAAALELPPGKLDLERWATEAAARLDRGSLRGRLVGMAQHMARWHAWKGQPELAGLCAAAARATEEHFASSPLVLAMLEHSLVPLDQDAARPEELDSLMLRQHLKGRFFQHVCVPKGRDLARLDFTEAALVFLEEALADLPGERRPREDDRTTAAFAIGKAFADFLIAGARWPIERVISQMTRALRDGCHLEVDECRRVVAVVLPALGDFIEQHCAGCPVACLDRPTEDVTDAFFAPHHPVGPDEEQGDHS